MVRRALGRGLDALIPDRPPEVAPSRPQLAELDIELIRPNPRQPRDHFDDEAIGVIAESLRLHGVLQPIVVRRVEGGYELIAGERRWRAAQRAGLERVPAVVREASPQESLELALVENLHREDLNPIEEALAYNLLIDEMGLTQEDVASRVGRDRSSIANTLRLLKLPQPVQQLVVNGGLSMGHARAILGLHAADAQTRLGEEVVAKGLSVRQVESRVRSLTSGERRRQARTAVDADVAAAEEKLSRALGTKVAIRGKERGRLEIRFTSMDELNRLYEMLLKSGRS